MNNNIIHEDKVKKPNYKVNSIIAIYVFSGLAVSN